ncbi:MAG TPA: TadE/TadG family type IV pilus assembly protein [Gemmataceae bacterium]|nr:TadE/TadG family type IV pilus assembly protein [Gemmataceae bacterium]
MQNAECRIKYKNVLPFVLHSSFFILHSALRSHSAWRSRRAGFAATESIVILPILMLLIIGTVVGGYGVFRYQQIAMLAREGARYASVHGGQYQQDTGNTSATAQDVYNNGIAPYATNLDRSQLTYSVSWNSGNTPYSMSGEYEKPTGNTVTVTINYNWVPELYLVGPITLSSTSTVPMAY